MDQQLEEELAAIRGARIYFGHHSVGDNLLAGLAELAREAGVEVKIDEGRVGQNQDPKSKVDAWSKKVLAEPPQGAKIVFMKFCYVDFNPDTNVDAVFAAYEAAVDQIEKARPDLTVMHVTAPLTVLATDVKSKMKRMLGKDVWEDVANLRRFEFNERMRRRYAGRPLFDLATVESTTPSGASETLTARGQRVPCLVPAYTDDGGHLNALGRRTGARALVRALALAVKAHAAKAA